MRPFDDLTRPGQARRLRSLVADVMHNGYGFESRRIRLLSTHSFNTMFRIDVAADGRRETRLVLRVGERPRIHAAGVEDVEAAWLEQLAADTDLCAPRPVAGPDGRTTRTWVTPDIDGERTCSLFTWVDGRRLREALTLNGLVEMGRVAALLHEHAAGWHPSPDPGTRTLADRVVYLGATTLVETDLSTSGSLVREALDRVQEHLDRLWAAPPHRPRLIHSDVGPHNMLMYRNRARPIDFQDLQIGFDLQDVAISVADLRRTAPDGIESFRDGYTRVRPWPLVDPELEAALVAGRSLNVINLGLQLRRAGIDRFLAEHRRIVVDWMQR